MAGRLLFSEPKLIPIFRQFGAEVEFLITRIDDRLYLFDDDRKDGTEVEPLTWLIEAKASLKTALKQIGYGVDLCVQQGCEDGAECAAFERREPNQCES